MGIAEWDVVVVGAGTAGCPLAARLADAGRRVLLLEAGADHVRGFPEVVRDPTRLAAAVPGAAQNWDLPALLTGERLTRVPRGRVVGGSSAINAAVFIRATPADVESWDLPGWSWDDVLPFFRRLESDADFPHPPLHGADGPVPVRRLPSSPLADAFAEAARTLGVPDEPDKNGAGPPGYGPIPFAVADGVRVNTAMAYLSPRRDLPGLTVRGDTTVRRVLVSRGRAVGVLTDDGPVHAGEVVLSAGAVGSPHLLLRSGIGPAAELHARGVDVVADVPGVGADATNHPLVYLTWRPTAPLPVASPLHGVLHVDDLELLPWLAPFGRVMGTNPEDGDLSVGVALMREDSRGRLRLGPDGAPLVEYRYLTEERDLRRLRAGVRLAAELLRAPSLAGLGVRTDPHDSVLDDDAALDGWIHDRLTTAVHLCGTARMGPDGDAGAVVDGRLRVRGVGGLRVVDTSVLPRVTSRGPAATAVMLGERAAELMAGA